MDVDGDKSLVFASFTLRQLFGRLLDQQLQESLKHLVCSWHDGSVLFGAGQSKLGFGRPNQLNTK